MSLWKQWAAVTAAVEGYRTHAGLCKGGEVTTGVDEHGDPALFCNACNRSVRRDHTMTPEEARTYLAGLEGFPKKAADGRLIVYWIAKVYRDLLDFDASHAEERARNAAQALVHREPLDPLPAVIIADTARVRAPEGFDGARATYAGKVAATVLLALGLV